jgi:hypothetical protein
LEEEAHMDKDKIMQKLKAILVEIEYGGDVERPILGHYRIDETTKIINITPARSKVCLQLIRKPSVGGEVWDLSPSEATRMGEGLIAAACIARCPDGKLPR